MKKIISLVGACMAVFGVHSQVLGQAASTEELVYNGKVGRIINENCVVCHREGGIGPMQFETYDQVRPWAPLIQYKVSRREMPPYAYDHGIGIQDLQGDWRLSQDEIDTVVAWVNAGAPLGDPENALPPLNLPDPNEWSFAADLGQPDMIIPSVPIDIPASGNDLWLKHNVATGLTTDRCIKAVQVKPRGDAKSVVHHANSNVEVPDEDGEFQRYGMLTEYAMGKWGELVPDGVCRTLPAGSRVAWDIHMFPGGVGAMAQGKMIEDNVVEIGLWFHEEGYGIDTPVYKQDLSLYQISPQGDLVIEPNGYQMTQGFHSFDHPVRLDSFQPHGHLRMRHASLEIFYPETGRTEAISQVSNWSATWHHSHIFGEDSAPLLPAGAVLVLKQWYDNTSDNPNNPDSDQWVVGGSRTGDEMTHAWIAVTHLDDAGFEKLVADRKEKEERAVAGND
ncbi:MAG: cytochrome c [Gammaproteobacteria bacterium]|nr:cytochrome c [Gammaproteobacteria bacterium]